MISRRSVLRLVPSLGIGSAVFARALAQEAAGSSELTREMIAAAKWVSGIELTEDQENEVLREVNTLQKQLTALRAFKLDPQNDSPALVLESLGADHAPASAETIVRNSWPLQIPSTPKPSTEAELAFSSVSTLSNLIRSRQISSVELTKIYLERLKKYDPLLLCVVNLTEELALQQATRCDRELAAGKYRGPLHGIPWGAKDLISVPGYPTTWGIPVFKDRVLNETATVAKRLEEAGAVLVAKLSLGAIAMGDRWFGGMTRNPWNPKIGSSGSSAGSACAATAGLVGFALGSETLGSILSPSARCGTHGLRPTFGRVSRAGCMPLSWSMDKIGPLARSVGDLAAVFSAIYGPDGQDQTVVHRSFVWPPPRPLDFKCLRVGVVPSRRENAPADESLEILRGLGCQIVEVKLPTDFPLISLTNIIDIEGAAVFDDLLRAGQTEGWNTWTKSFQTAQFITAIDYLRMQRVRRKLMLAFEEAIKGVDVLWNANDLMHTNFTGHPSVTLPFQIRRSGEVDVPHNVVITGHLFQEDKILALAQAFERSLPASLALPPLDIWLEKHAARELNPVASPTEPQKPAEAQKK
jgi:Asp-tRNA(Asn)/Glu-tRNA(Gln) amidotransferase A subunit family amidase